MDIIKFYRIQYLRVSVFFHIHIKSWNSDLYPIWFKCHSNDVRIVLILMLVNVKSIESFSTGDLINVVDLPSKNTTKYY